MLARAPASRTSFYQHFTSLDDCFWQAYAQRAAELLAILSRSLRERPDARERALLEALASYAAARPLDAQLLMREGLAAGPRGVRERNVLAGRIGELLSRARTGLPPLDISASLLAGGLMRLLCMSSEPIDPLALALDIRDWLQSFVARERPARFAGPPEPSLAAEERGGALAVQRSLPARERILRGVAAATRAGGYGALTVDGVVAAASVSRRTFYNEFEGTRAAFVAAYESAFQRTIAACAPAFFASGSWPERVWHSASAFTRFFSSERAFAHLALVECYALGPSFLARVHETQLAFTLFLEEGYRSGPGAESRPRVYLSLCQAVIFEAAFRAALAVPSLQWRRTQPLAVYVALAPSIGADAAASFLAAASSAEDRVGRQLVAPARSRSS